MSIRFTRARLLSLASLPLLATVFAGCLGDESSPDARDTKQGILVPIEVDAGVAEGGGPGATSSSSEGAGAAGGWGAAPSAGGGGWGGASSGTGGLGGAGGLGTGTGGGSTGGNTSSNGSGGDGSGAAGSGGDGSGAAASGGNGSASSSSSSGTGGGGGCPNPSTQPIQLQSMPPAALDEVLIGSPYTETASFVAAHGTLQFLVDMPYSSSQPYSLGVDFDGVAEICTRQDPSTGAYYDEVTLDMNWAYESGGAYHTYFGYLPYQVGLGAGSSPTVVEKVYIADGDSKNDKKAADCLSGASEEHAPFAKDIYLTPKMYLDNGDMAEAYGRGAYNPWQTVDSAQDIVNAINAAFTAKKNQRITVVFGGHGSVDWWRGWPGAFGTAGLGGNNAAVQALAGSQGKVERVYFESCCTGKGKQNGLNPNVLDSVSDSVTAGGQVWARVCGWNHTTFGWFRKGFHVGHVKGDALTCAH